MSARRTVRRLALAAVAMLGASSLTLGAAAPSDAALVYPSAPTSVFGSEGSGNGQFAGPLGVAVDDSTGDVYVVDQGNARVEKFDGQGAYLSQLTGGKTPAGSFSSPYSVAVDNSSDAEKGDVYVTDVGHGVIDVFDSGGTYVSQITGTPSSFAGELYGVAVDGSGNVWAYEGNGNVDEFSDSGTFLSQFNTGRGTEHGFAADSNGNLYLLYGSEAVGKYTPTGTKLAEWDEGRGAALAVNQSTNNVFVDTKGEIEEFGPFAEPYGEYVQRFGAGGSGLSSSRGIAVNDTTGTVYASQNGANSVAIFKQVQIPDVTPAALSNLAPTTATLNGTVNPDGEAIVSCQFEYGVTTDYGFTTPCSPSPSGASPVPVSANLVTLKKGTTYHYRLVTADANGASQTADSTFSTTGEAPVLVVAPSASEVTTQTVVLTGATVNQGGLATTYHYEYGTTTGYGSSTPELELTAGEERPLPPVTVDALASGTTYHYKLIIKNSKGTVASPDQTFSTVSLTIPIVGTDAGTSTSPASAMLAATIDPQGWAGTYGFEMGTSIGYTEQIAVGAFDAGVIGPQALAQAVMFLEPNTTYHFRVYLSTEAFGTLYGVDQAFTTPEYVNPLSIAPHPPLVSAPAIAFPTEKGQVFKGSVKKRKKAKVKKKKARKGKKANGKTKKKK